MTRPGRPPKQPTGSISTVTLKIPAEVKRVLIESSDAFGMSMSEYLSTLVMREVDGKDVTV